MKGKAHFQQTLASQPGFERYSRKSRREEFLSLMETVVPWRELEAVIGPYDPKAGSGRQPVGLSIMLRVYFLPQWSNLSDPGAEDALYESPALRRFAGVDLGRAPAPDETTILRFRRLLETHELCGQILDTVNDYLASRGCVSRRARLWMRRSSPRPAQRRTAVRSAIRRCTRRARATSGILA